MAITPTVYNQVLTDPTYQVSIYPSKTYYMNLETYRIQGKVDNIQSVAQAIYCALSTERTKYHAYSNNYGVELIDLIGQPMGYVIPELERRIKNALEWDTRINLVDQFEFEVSGSTVRATFTVHTIYGDIDAERTVEI